jgi:hypothetical protein
MTTKAGTGAPREPRAPKGTIRKVARTRRGTEITLRLRNDDSRPVHYISNVRTLRYDPAAKRVTVGLSDEGRVLVPGVANVHPAFNFIDPDSEAELHLVLPQRIVKLSEAGGPQDEVRFEEHDLLDADEIVVEVAWSDLPYYEDARPGARAGGRTPAEAWARGKVAMIAKPPGPDDGDRSQKR